MKAIVVSQYGGPEVMKYQDSADPSPGPDELLVRVAASVNPFDMKRRSGALKDFAPINFPGIIGVDVAGTVIRCGNQVKGFSPGDRVFGVAGQSYAEICVAKGKNLAKIPAKMDTVDAAALPLVTITGHQLITKGTQVKPGQTILVTGALGSVGRVAVYTAKSLGARVIAGVRKARLAQASVLGANSVVALDDEASVAKLEALDAVADAVSGPTAQTLIAKVKPGGVFASVLGAPENSASFPAVKVVVINNETDAQTFLKMAQAVLEGKLTIPIAAKLPLKDAAQAQVLMAKGANGKVLLLP